MELRCDRLACGGAMRLLIVAVWSAVVPWGLAGAQGLFRPLQTLPPGRFIEPPRAVQQQLREAERALEERRYSDAVVRLGDLLAQDSVQGEADDLSGQDFFLESADVRSVSQPIRKSFLRQARAMIGSLPREAMETYELRYGPLARKQLQEAALTRDWQSVREVRRKYFHTTAGYEASYLLAQQEMLTGHPLGASLYLDDVVPHARAVEHLGAGIVLMHAAACKLSGRDLPSLDTGVREGTITVGGQTLSLPDPSDLGSWLTEHFGMIGQVAAAPIRNYSLYGAQLDRNGSLGGQLPLSNERWMLDTTSSPLQERSVRETEDELATSGKLPPPSWIPLRVNDQLLMRTTERLVGIDHRTGKRVWTYPWQSGYELFGDEEPSLDELSGGDGESDLLTQRVWNDVPYGQITSDGERVYILDNLREVEPATMHAMLNLRGVRQADTSFNTLVALELATEGKLRWRLGAGADGPSSLSDAFFLGPPLPVDGRLYVIAEIAGDINLCCLDPATGVELWRQQLVAVESGGIEADPVRRVAGAMPSYHEGVLICPTGAGAIVAVDLADRMFRWGVSFERNDELFRSVAGSGRSLETGKLMQRWFTGAAVAAENTVLVTPIESDRLYGIELLTGESLFEEKNRVHMRYLAGIRDGMFFVVGSHQVRAFDLQTGAAVWTTPRDMLNAGQQISGVGVFGDTDYYLPTSTNEIVQIDLKDGTVKQRRQTRYPLGNLVAVDGELISQSPTSLAVAFGEATLEPMVNEILSKDPNDFDAMVRKSELLIQQGERPQALELLARARQMQPDNDEVRMLSVAAMLGQLRESDRIDRELVETLGRLIDRPAQRVELLALQVRAALRSGQRVEAAETLFELSQLIASEPLLEKSANSLLNDSTRQCSLDSWLAARAAQLAAEATETELSQVNEMLTREMEEVRSSSTGLLVTMLRHFGMLAGSEPLRMELASRMRKEQSYLELERLALEGQIPDDATLAGLSVERLRMLADAYSLGGMPRDGLRVLDQLAARGDAAEPGDLVEQRAALELLVKRHEWPQDVSLNWDPRTTRIIRSISPTRRFSEICLLAGQQFEGWRLVGEGSSPLGFQNPLGAFLRIPVEGDISDAEKKAVICGGVMVVVTRGELIGVNLFNLINNVGDPLLWQRSVSGDSGAEMSRRSSTTPFDDQVVRYAVDNSLTSNIIPEFWLGPIMGDRVLVLQGGDLMAIDLLTSETLWRNSSAPLSGAVLCDGNRVAVVSSATEEVVFFDPLDGQKLGSQKWAGGEIWEASGRHVLSYRQTPVANRYDILLSNPFAGEVVLEQQAMGANRSNVESEVESSYGRVDGARFLAFLDNRGQALLWDLVEGKEICRQTLPAYPDLIGLHVMRLADAMVFLPKLRAVQSTAPDAPQLQTSDGKYHVAVNGVHAVSMKDGAVLWGHQFEEPWGCTLTQPADTPLLLLARSPFTYSTTSRRKTLDVLALDVRDGRIVEKTEGRAIMSGNNQLETKITVQPNSSRLLVEVGVEQLLYNFGVAGAAEEVEAREVGE